MTLKLSHSHISLPKSLRFSRHGSDDSDNKVNQRWRRVPLFTLESLVTTDASVDLNEPTAVRWECGETTNLTGAALVEDGDFKTIR